MCMKKLLKTVVISVGVVLLLAGCTKKKELSACDEKRKIIEEKYGITVCYGENNLKGEKVSELKLSENPEKIDRVLDEMEEYFSKLPEGFLEEITSISQNENRELYIVISEGSYKGVSLKTEGIEYWIINEKETTSLLAEDTMRSIIYHFETKEENDYFMLFWDLFNPKEFKYGLQNENKKYLYGVASDEECYFMLEETLEDKAEEQIALFSFLWDSTVMNTVDFGKLPKVKEKMEYLCSELDRVFETVDENAYWARYINNKG